VRENLAINQVSVVTLWDFLIVPSRDHENGQTKVG
jgi:hypothetical protein